MSGFTMVLQRAETWGTKCAISKIGGPKSQVLQTWEAKSAFKPIKYLVLQELYIYLSNLDKNLYSS